MKASEKDEDFVPFPEWNFRKFFFCNYLVCISSYKLINLYLLHINLPLCKFWHLNG